MAFRCDKGLSNFPTLVALVCTGRCGRNLPTISNRPTACECESVCDAAAGRNDVWIRGPAMVLT